MSSEPFTHQASGIVIVRHTLHIFTLVQHGQDEDLSCSISIHVWPHFPTHLPYAVSKHIKLSLTLKYTKSPSPVT